MVSNRSGKTRVIVRRYQRINRYAFATLSGNFWDLNRERETECGLWIVEAINKLVNNIIIYIIVEFER